MKTGSQHPKAIYLKNYSTPNYFVESIDLIVDLYDEYSLVTSIQKLYQNKSKTPSENTLSLNGEELELLSIKIDDKELTPEQYQVTSEQLILKDLPKEFTVTIQTKIYPQKNTSLEGLYKSGDMYCTQCEAEGFRKITYYLDRPDVLTTFKTKISADKTKYPYLLSNGNPIDSGDLENNRHFVTWHDPFPKPCYLFALVAGDLFVKEGSFKTCSGRNIKLQVFVEPQDADKSDYAIECIQKSMKWDEEKYGREYDLDIFMLVAVSAFNFGAMENKGLNIFNNKYALANPETATDQDYQHILSIIGHEYFHNWSGNRVTCRDWFQLSLKEGLTVFREQQFTEDMTSKAVARIDQVDTLRKAQFPEDASPMAHPIRPESYIEINNFYTATVYEKGAEVIRMIYQILGPKAFRKATDHYFSKHDGEAATTEDFVTAMEESSGIDLKQFRIWYSQAGTPELTFRWNYKQNEKSFTLFVEQKTPPTPNQKSKANLHIPVKTALLDSNGNKLSLHLEGYPIEEELVLNVTEETNKFVFKNIPEAPTPSFLREFSAPVNSNTIYSDEDLIFLLQKDSDEFNRWEAGQRLFTKYLLKLIENYQKQEDYHKTSQIITALQTILADEQIDGSFKSRLLKLPQEIHLFEAMNVSDPTAIHFAKDYLQKEIGLKLEKEFAAIYNSLNHNKPYSIDSSDIAERTLKNLSLLYLVATEKEEYLTLALKQHESANNMTDELSSLQILTHVDCPQKDQAFGMFYDKWKNNSLVIDKWFSMQAISAADNTLGRIQKLENHEMFDFKNPNKVRSLFSVFSMLNLYCFHKDDGKGYEYISDKIIQLDAINASVAARMANCFKRWKKLDNKRQGLIKSSLEKILSQENLSKGTYEVVSKILK